MRLDSGLVHPLAIWWSFVILASAGNWRSCFISIPNTAEPVRRDVREHLPSSRFFCCARPMSSAVRSAGSCRVRTSSGFACWIPGSRASCRPIRRYGGGDVFHHSMGDRAPRLR